MSQIDLPCGAFYEISKHSHFRNDFAHQNPSATQTDLCRTPTTFNKQMVIKADYFRTNL